jgi:AraC family transcriptional regulator, exoenzyme S synthesis regulatory protein ExsA
MLNFYDFIKAHPEELKQFSFKDLLFLIMDCPPDFSKSEDWAEHNCFIHVLRGINRMYTREHSWQLEKGSTVFLRKGAIGIEKLVPEATCALMFYVSDEYIRSFMKENSALIPPLALSCRFNAQVIAIQETPVMTAFYESVATYFSSGSQLSEHLLELKFKELLLNIVTSESNLELVGYFCKLAQSGMDDLQEIMENNCHFNLHLEDYARLCHRSLSTYKRDFYNAFGTAPGRWLQEKRLERACGLLRHTEKPISDVVLESGFVNFAHFDKLFKKQFGVTPLKYRRQFSIPAIYTS